MNKKSECEQAVRSLAREWFNGLPDVEREHPGWPAFKTWVGEKHYSLYLVVPPSDISRTKPLVRLVERAGTPYHAARKLERSALPTKWTGAKGLAAASVERDHRFFRFPSCSISRRISDVSVFQFELSGRPPSQSGRDVDSGGTPRLNPGRCAREPRSRSWLLNAVDLNEGLTSHKVTMMRCLR